MRVKLKGDMSGSRNGVPWPARGEEVDLPDDEGAALCAGGMAEPVKSDSTETAVAPRSEERSGDDKASASRASEKPKPKPPTASG